MIKAAAAVAVFCMLCQFFRYIYVTEDDWARIFWHNYYAREDNIDNVYLGSSHVYCGINPFVLDEKNGQNNYNISIGYMRMNGAYYALKEVLDQNDVTRVVLDMDYFTTTGTEGDLEDKDTVTYNWYVADGMKWSMNKVRFLLSATDSSFYADSFFPFLRFKSYMFDRDYIRQTVASKQTDAYRNAEYRIEDESGVVEYQKKGYGYSTRQLQGEDRLIYQHSVLQEESPLTASSEAYLRKLIELCRDRNVELVLIAVPIYDLQTICAEHYDAYTAQIRQIADEYGLSFYDFNLSRSEYLDIQKPEYFMNFAHLNATGAKLFSSYLDDVLSTDRESAKEQFWDSLADRMSGESPKICGVYYYSIDSGSYCRVAASRSALDVDYTVTAAVAGGKTYQVSEYFPDPSEDYIFVLPADEHGTLTITGVEKATGIELEPVTVSY
jgi:hypothetical protein